MIDQGLLKSRMVLLRLPNLSYPQRKALYKTLGAGKEIDHERLRKAVSCESMLDAAFRQAEADIRALERGRIRTLWLGEDGYPPLLKEISDPPLALFVRGTLPDASLDPVAIVGTRQPSALGIAEARRFGRECAERGLPCVSGLALGIDAWAHRGYLEAAGSALAVLGHGLDMVYPPSNRSLARRILETGGALVSEYLPGIPAWKWHFPARNRIISGLSRGVIIVDAPQRSGSLITADYALDQGRDVWVSGAMVDSMSSPDSPRGAFVRSEGVLHLFDQGARALSSIDEVLVDWGMTPPELTSREPVAALGEAGTASLAGLELARALSADLCGGNQDSKIGHS